MTAMAKDAAERRSGDVHERTVRPHSAVAEPWFMIEGGRYAGPEPPFLDPSDYPWVKTLEDNWRVFRDELLGLLARHEERLVPYFNKRMMFPPLAWKTMGLSHWNLRFRRNCRECPQTMRILRTIPNLTAASLSVLEPRSNINPHHGDTDAIIRVHVGLVVPASLPACGFQVGKEIRGWEEGKALLFTDAITHAAWNQSDRRRMVMIIDVMRDEYAPRTNDICARVLGAIGLHALYQRFPALSRLPGGVKLALYGISRRVFRVLLPLQRRIGWWPGP
jgi:aspartyl/asparaginyl beta-hydroxylase (cupin superfamily)